MDKRDKNYNSAVKLYEKAKKDLLSAKTNSDRSNALSRLDGLNKYFSKKDDKKAKPSSSTKKEEKKTTQTNSTTQGNTNTSNAEPMTDKSEVVEDFTPEYEINPKLINEENPVGGSSEKNGKSEIIEQAQVIAEEYIENKIFKEPDWWSEMKFNDFSLRKSISNKLVDAVQREKSLNDIEFVASFYINYRMAMLGNTGTFTGYGKIADYSYTLAQTIVDEQPSFFDVSLINRKSLMNAANDVVKLEESNFKYLLLDKNEKFVEQLNVVNDNIREQKFEIYDNENDNIILKSEILKYISKVIYINENLVQSKAMWKSLQGR
ncbi:hypothetical protein [Fusibacter sp. JL216-2]|uniref:hypothetical protein n=1 Tax=Fusibacter sp. JL216-2 TaxID=3071453 RepID=UPI003D344291